MDAKKWTIRLLLLLTLAVAAQYVYNEFVSPFDATADTIEAMISGEDVEVTVQDNGNLVFTPLDVTAEQGLIFYTGARVEPEAYANIARGVAERGFLVVIVKHPFNYAFLGVSKANDVIAAYPEIQGWTLGGHSLGGAMATDFVERNTRIRSLVMLGAYPGEGTNMTLRTMNVLALYGENDLLATPAEVVDAVEQRLPDSADLVEIAGGNHAQFGSYGSQDGDGIAQITAEQQQSIVIDEIVKHMRG